MNKPPTANEKRGSHNSRQLVFEGTTDDRDAGLLPGSESPQGTSQVPSVGLAGTQTMQPMQLKHLITTDNTSVFNKPLENSMFQR